MPGLAIERVAQIAPAARLMAGLLVALPDADEELVYLLGRLGDVSWPGPPSTAPIQFLLGRRSKRELSLSRAVAGGRAGAPGSGSASRVDSS